MLCRHLAEGAELFLDFFPEVFFVFFPFVLLYFPCIFNGVPPSSLLVHLFSFIFVTFLFVF